MPSTGVKLVRDYGCGAAGYTTSREPEVIEGLAQLAAADNGDRELAIVHDGQILARISPVARYEREAGGVVLLGSSDALSAIEEGHQVRVVLAARRIHNLTTGRNFTFRR